MNPRNLLYHFLVNRHPGIGKRYHRVHDGSMGAMKFFSWLYLAWLNFAYYFLFCRFLGKVPESQFYENKNLLTGTSESANYLKEHPSLSVSGYVEKLSDYDIISFDIFDTLIFRPFALPVDLFRIVGEQMQIMDFTNIRIWSEWDARQKCKEKYGHMEVTLADIYRNLEEDVGVSYRQGMSVEIKTELELCYANPFMLEVWRELLQKGKRLIVVSDMYLPSGVLEQMLIKNGFEGFERLYVSCEYGKNKASGSLYRKVLFDLGNAGHRKGLFRKKALPIKMIHVGDNLHSDGDMARANGIDSLLYPRIDQNALLYRAFDMSFLTGSAYRGIVTNHLYNGSRLYSMEYEYGFIYGGLFVAGYCNFIHTYCKSHGIEKLLFLSRDGDILKRAYDRMYPSERQKTEYVYWSRKAATVLMADEDRHDYFRRFIEAKWEKVLSAYQDSQAAAKKYYQHSLKGIAKAAAIDIGWAGSGAMALRHLVPEVWGIPCEITGLIAGTNTLHNAEPDAAEPFLQSGKLVSYMFSQQHNRDLLKKHDLNKDYNIFWELLLSSPTPQFVGFANGKQKDGEKRRRYLKNLDVTLLFGKYDKNQKGIREVQQGILDFVEQYLEHFKKYPYMFRISGRDAYAPMLLAASRHEKYLKAIEKKFALEVNVN